MSTTLKTTWRLLLSPPAPGVWNMAVDEAILEAVEEGESPGTLRLYAWNPPCLSLGYAQPFADVDPKALAARGWHVVRRPTGGRAILHADELTYAVIGPLDDPRLSGSLLESYQRLSRALLDALRRLGLPAQSDAEPEIAPGSDPQGAVCFEVPSNYEITVNGKKLLGSAQARRKNGLLQHGSLPLHGDLTRIVQALRFDSDAAREQAAQRLLERATTVKMALKQAPDWAQAAQAFQAAFTETLGVELQTGALTCSERERAADLMINKYASLDWTQRI